MSSIRTGMPARRFPSLVPRARATARSASLSAAQIQVALASGPSAASPSATPAIIPPPPRLGISEPSAPNWYDTGPRLDATSTR
jgi:hypothetical protein